MRDNATAKGNPADIVSARVPRPDNRRRVIDTGQRIKRKTSFSLLSP